MNDWPAIIVQDDINAYAEVSGDFNPIHVDPEFARTTPYGTTIAHGCIAGALMTRYLVEDMGFTGRVRSLSVKFVSAVRSGDGISCHAEPLDGDAGMQRYQVSCRNQDGATIAVGTAGIAGE